MSQSTEKYEKTISLPLEWPYRLLGNAILICLVFSLAIITVTIKEELVTKSLSDLSDYFYEKSSELGFTIDDIIVENRNKTSIEAINEVLNIDRNSNILNLNVKDLKTRLEYLPWIKSVTIRRSFFPNILHISLTEKEVEAIWQYDGKFYPLDENGDVINSEYIPSKQTLLIVGKSAPENLKSLLDVIKKDEEAFSHIKAANFISERRWDIIFDDIDDGILVKLPENDFNHAWSKLLTLKETEGIFKRKLTIIDLRLPDKLIVKIGKSDSDSSSNKNKVKETKI